MSETPMSDTVPMSETCPTHKPISYTVTLRDGVEERVVGADAYQQEQSMTTFFRTEGRRTVDCWAVRMASFRTDNILAVRREEAALGAAQQESVPEQV